jgi:hypothetical protein
MPKISCDTEILPSGDYLRVGDDGKQDQSQQVPQHNFSILPCNNPYKEPLRQIT